MNKSTVNVTKSQIEIPQSKAEKRKLIKEIVDREMKRKYESAKPKAATALPKKSQSLLIPTRQKLLLDLGVSPQRAPTASPSKSSPSILIDPNSPRKSDPRSKASPPARLSALKASASPRLLSARNSDTSDHSAEVTESGRKFEGKTKEPKKEKTLTRKKMTKEEAERKKQGHREMVRGLFGKLDFLVGGGLG